MATTGAKPSRKPRRRAPSKRASRPSFTPVPAADPGAQWAYRSDLAALEAPRATQAPVAPQAPSRPARSSQAMDALTLPIAIALMAVLVPVRWLLGPRSRG